MKKLALAFCLTLTSWIAPAALASPSEALSPPQCYASFCVGEVIYNTERNFRQAQILAIAPNGKFTIQFLDTGGVGGNWDYFDFARSYGCILGNQYCVGQLVHVIPRNYRIARVVGIQFNNRMVLRFEDTGGVGGNWGPAQLVKIGATNPHPMCPPGMHWDPVIGSCVHNNPPPKLWTCQVYQFKASDYSQSLARQKVLHQCAISSGGYVCQGSQVTCY